MSFQIMSLEDKTHLCSFFVLFCFCGGFFVCFFLCFCIVLVWVFLSRNIKGYVVVLSKFYFLAISHFYNHNHFISHILHSSIRATNNSHLHTMTFYSSMSIHVFSSLPGMHLLLFLYLNNSYSPFLNLFRCHLFDEIFFDILRLISSLCFISTAHSTPLFTSFFKLDFSGLYILICHPHWIINFSRI